MRWARTCLLLGAFVVVGCATGARPGGGPLGRSPLFPFDDAPHPNTKNRLVQALVDRGYLPPERDPARPLDGPVRAFQRAEGLSATGWPDDATLQRLGIDPAARDRSLAPSSGVPAEGTGAGVGR